MERFARFVAGIVVGAGLGLVLGVGLTLIALLIFVGRGVGVFERNGTDFLHVVLSYLVGGVGAGAVAGGLHGLARRPWGAALVGICAMVPLYGAVAFAADGWAGVANLRALVTMAILVGTPVGVVYHRMFTPPAEG